MTKDDTKLYCCWKKENESAYAYMVLKFKKVCDNCCEWEEGDSQHTVVSSRVVEVHMGSTNGYESEI